MIVSAIAALALTVSTITTAVPSPPAPSTTITADRLSREEAAARSSRAQDMRGQMPSLYRGIYFYADQEPFRLCVAEREGSFHYDVQGGGGGNYFGTYQFSKAFQPGAAYMMAKESRKTHDGLRAAALGLRYIPINQWSRYWQDRAFYTVLNYNGKWSGKGHWAGGRWHC